MKNLFFGLVILMISGCGDQPTNHPVFQYFPPEGVMEEGYVNKFYYHYYPDNKDQRAVTYIEYNKVVMLDENHFRSDNYNAGFQLTSSRIFEVKGDTIRINSGKNYQYHNKVDTTEMDLISSTVSVWTGEMEESLQLRFESEEEMYIYSEQQVAVYDSLIMERPAKVFRTTWNTRKEGTDSTFNAGTSTAYYVQGLGFFGSDSKGNGFTRKAELIEQLSLKEFERRAGHDEHRVAWIDPKNTLSDDESFQLCGHELNIADYYNSTPDGRYIHSKRAMVDTIYSNLDKSKLFDQEGRLTFRFVVNCEGKAGRFIAEGYDLNYQPMEFRKETVDHLFGILQKLEEWRPVVLKDGPRDAYFYITFNIENGEIIDILP